ncbi:carbonic anhydrase [Erythrobacter litoralis]|uniref:Carbonic anhydrase n=1 Tax=Erythrobacter litoralis TaxID=39960 RepID=A0A074MVG9_9SPHN|nr:carbonic anhydrase [Erythrobacter litoralis]AOL23504.1 carbonic anhydrase [Erythrobacter litoralis]KEO99011.1 carbonate dehydratase [Erythrobacter litoralis]
MPEFAELLKGYRRFREQTWPRQRERFAETLEKGQHPKLMIIACCDSRVDPAQIFDVDPGDIFVLRNVAALVPPFETTPGQHGVSAAVEFAVQVLEVAQIVVMGHGRCGGCQAALRQDYSGDEESEGRFLAGWITLLDEARAEVASHYGTESPEAELEMEFAAIRQSLANLRTFPWLAAREAEGRLKLRGSHFSIAEGRLYSLDEATGHFEVIE